MPIIQLSPEVRDALLDTLKERFVKNPARHRGIEWPDVQSRLEANPGKCWSLNEMERTGGEPDVVGRDATTGEITFMDCSPESPTDRRNLCYDLKAQEGRKKFPPAQNALSMAAAMGIEVLTEAEYRALQELGEFDRRTSSWVQTPPAIRQLGGALFCDRRYGTVFVYHNGADSYYGARGFRGVLRV